MTKLEDLNFRASIRAAFNKRNGARYEDCDITTFNKQFDTMWKIIYGQDATAGVNDVDNN